MVFWLKNYDTICDLDVSAYNKGDQVNHIFDGFKFKVSEVEGY